MRGPGAPCNRSESVAGIASLQLLFISNHLRRMRIRLDLIAHLLNQRRLLFQLRLKRINLFLLILHLAMRFEELV